MKLAVTVRFAVIVTEHVVPEDESQPDQEVNVESSAGLAVKVTRSPLT